MNGEPLSPRQSLLLSGASIAAYFLALFNAGSYNAINPHAMGAFGVSPSHGPWTMGDFFAAQAFGLVLGPALSARFGYLEVFRGSIWTAAAGSLLCAAAPTFLPFLGGRILQGFGSGVAVPLAQTILLEQHPEERRPVVAAFWSMAGLAPYSLSPVAGALMEERWGWRSWFLVNAPLLLLAGEICVLLAGRPDVRPSRPWDRIGALLLGSGILSIQSALNMGDDYDWYNSPLVVGLLLGGLIAIAYFVVWELGERYPLIDLRLFLRPGFSVGILTMTVAFFFFFGLWTTLLVRVQLPSFGGFTSFLAAQIFVPLLFLSLPAAGLFSQLPPKAHHLRLFACGNLLLFSLYCWLFSYYDYFERRSWFFPILGTQVLEGLCLGTLLRPLGGLMVAGLSPRKQAYALELSASFRALASGLGIDGFVSILYRRTAFDQKRLTETFPPFGPMTDEVLDRLHQSGLGEEQGLGWLLNHRLLLHANILSLEDAFRFAAWGFLVMAAMLALVPVVRLARRWLQESGNP
ncbi:putative Drug resistance transporter, EmrB/QacA subfamily [Methylacidimicrobium sp. AP8]|uniref:MFS transporter n=1 Tax=Methylacidimicrobium sp. AP8 TaxID=2730359 RepID=UPI0018BFC441|nr:MFS transporter [Methylacidimicrobium sp. AP8]CAB4243218.1 putative Drug resistance transporter, EmrB/QacA subfamily [Methylacidimicrobium sp. AP8]